MVGEGENEVTVVEDDVFGKSVVEERRYLCKRLTVNEAMTEGVEENMVDLCFTE